MHEKSVQDDAKFLTAGVARLLLGELLEHLASTGDPVTTLANGDVQNQFIDLNRAHDIVLFRLSINGNAVSLLHGSKQARDTPSCPFQKHINLTSSTTKQRVFQWVEIVRIVRITRPTNAPVNSTLFWQD